MTANAGSKQNAYKTETGIGYSTSETFIQFVSCAIELSIFD